MGFRPDSEIKLGFSGGVFHTKLYLFENVRGAVSWLGSANATSAGLEGHNEEILVRISPAPSGVIAYAQRAWAEARQLGDCRVPVNSLTAFFRTGMLYYKPYALLSKTFNPFKPLMTSLPPEERNKISAFRSEFAEEEGGIGAFSIDRVLKRDLEYWAAVGTEAWQHKQSDVSNGNRLQFRQYAVETCYGYWVSEKYEDTVDSMLEQASKIKLMELQHLRDWLRRREEFIVEAFASYLETARETMDSQDVDWKGHADSRVFEDTGTCQEKD